MPHKATPLYHRRLHTKDMLHHHPRNIQPKLLSSYSPCSHTNSSPTHRAEAPLRDTAS